MRSLALMSCLVVVLCGCHEILGIRAGESAPGGGGQGGSVAGPGGRGGGGEGGEGGEGGGGQGGVGGSGGDPCVGASDYREEVLCDQPLGYWRFEETAATGTLLDETNAFPLTIFSGMMASVDADVTGMLGTSGMELNGGTLEQTAEEFAFSGLSAMTVELWILFPDNWTANVTGASHLISYNSNTDGWLVQVVGAGHLQFIREVADIRDMAVVSDFSTEATELKHIVLTFDGVTLRVFVQGALRHAMGSSSSIQMVDSEFQVGSGNLFNAPLVIDELAVYPHALSQERVRAHCAAGMPPGGCE